MPNLSPILSLRGVPLPDQIIVPVALDFIRKGIHPFFRVSSAAGVQVLAIPSARVFEDARLRHALGHLPELVVPRERGHAEFFAASVVRCEDFLFEAWEIVVEVGITIAARWRTLGVGAPGADSHGERGGGAGEESSGYEEEKEGGGVQHLCFTFTFFL